MDLPVSMGELLGLVCAVIGAAHSLVVRTQLRKVPPVLMNVVLCGVASVFYWVLLATGPPLAAYGQVLPVEWALLIGSVLIGHAPGDTLFLSALKETGVSRTLALVGTYPLSTLLFQWVLLRHPVHSGLAGVWLVL